jgi:hypothetical protein
MDGSRVVNLNLGPSTGVKTWDYLETSETTGRHFKFSPLNVSGMCVILHASTYFDGLCYIR